MIITTSSEKSLLKQIKAYRRRLCITQREMAKLTGVHTNTLSLWESGKKSPGIDQLIEIMRVLVRYSSDDLTLILNRKHVSNNQDSDDSDVV